MHYLMLWSRWIHFRERDLRIQEFSTRALSLSLSGCLSSIFILISKQAIFTGHKEGTGNLGHTQCSLCYVPVTKQSGIMGIFQPPGAHSQNRFLARCGKKWKEGHPLQTHTDGARSLWNGRQIVSPEKGD